MITERSKNVLFGIFVISTCVVTLWLLLFLRPSYGDGRQHLSVRFPSIEKVSVGTKVTFAGKPVGKVKAINYIYEARTEPSKDVFDHIYFYELELAIDSSVQVYTSDEIMLSTSGLLGEKVVAIKPMRRMADKKERLIKEEEVIYASSAGPMAVEEALRQVVSLARKVEKSMETIFKFVEKEEMWDNFDVLLRNTKDITQALNRPEAWDQIIKNIETFSSGLSSSWNLIENSIKDFSGTSQNIRIMTDKLTNFISDTQEGKNTLGRLFAKKDVYLRVMSLADKLDVLMNDINHYGILFHLDKKWQRVRAKRINILERLKKPEDFKNYFDLELMNISTSLSRVSLLLEKVKEEPSQELLEKENFSQSFYELLNRVSNLKDTLNLYNQQFFQKD